MAKFTSTKDLNLSFEGHKFAGPAGTTAGPGAALTHAVTQPNDHAAQSHDSPNSEPPYYALCFIQKS